MAMGPSAHNNPTFLPNNYEVEIFLNTTTGSAPTRLTLGPGRCQQVIVEATTSPEWGKASFVLYTGKANVNSGDVDNFQCNSVSEQNAFVEGVRGAIVNVYTWKSDQSKNDSIVGDVLTYRSGLPDGSSTAVISGGDTKVCILSGKIMTVDHTFGVYSQHLAVNAVDWGGFFSIRQFMGGIQKWYSFGESTAAYALIHPHNLPDWNQKENEVMSPNRDVDGPQTVELSLPDYTVELTMNPFNCIDLTHPAGSTAVLWTDLDIVTYVFDYFISYHTQELDFANLHFAINDHTNNLSAGFGTYSSRQSLWNILQDCVNRKNGLFSWWSYDGGSGSLLTITFNIGFANDDAIGDYDGLETLEYTLDGGYPVGLMRSDLNITYVDNDAGKYVRISTEGCNLVGTFNLKDQFYEGWDTLATPPDDEEIKKGGISATWYSRFKIKTTFLNRISSYGLLSDASTEGWTDSAAALGVEWKSGLDESDPQVDVISIIAAVSNLPNESTIKIQPTIPLVTLDPTVAQAVKNSPALLFIKDAVDSATPIDDCHMHMLGGSVSFNPPDSSNAFGGIDRYKDPSDRTDIFLTCTIENTPPLTYMVAKDGIKNNDPTIIDIELPIKPTFLLNNACVKIDETGTLQHSEPNPSGVASLVVLDGTTLKDIRQIMLRTGVFFARRKNKTKWTISFVDPTNLLGKFVSLLDVPMVYNAAVDGDVITGIGLERYNRMTVNTIMSKTIWNFANNSTTYITDWQNFIPGKGHIK